MQLNECRSINLLTLIVSRERCLPYGAEKIKSQAFNKCFVGASLGAMVSDKNYRAERRSYIRTEHALSDMRLKRFDLFLQLAVLVHLQHDIATTNEFALNIQLGNSRPV